ncbi:unnamed protein product [Urochloa humidicola]
MRSVDAAGAERSSDQHNHKKPRLETKAEMPLADSLAAAGGVEAGAAADCSGMAVEEIVQHPLPGYAAPVALSFCPDDRRVACLYSPDGTLHRKVYTFDIGQRRQELLFGPPDGGGLEEGRPPRGGPRRRRGAASSIRRWGRSSLARDGERQPWIRRWGRSSLARDGGRQPWIRRWGRSSRRRRSSSAPPPFLLLPGSPCFSAPLRFPLLLCSARLAPRPAICLRGERECIFGLPICLCCWRRNVEGTVASGRQKCFCLPLLESALKSQTRIVCLE